MVASQHASAAALSQTSWWTPGGTLTLCWLCCRFYAVDLPHTWIRWIKGLPSDLRRGLRCAIRLSRHKFHQDHDSGVFFGAVLSLLLPLLLTTVVMFWLLNEQCPLLVLQLPCLPPETVEHSLATPETAKAQGSAGPIAGETSNMVERLEGSSSGEYIDVCLASGEEPDAPTETPASVASGADMVPRAPATPLPRPIQDLRSVSWRVSGVVADALRMEGNTRLRRIVTHVPWGFEQIRSLSIHLHIMPPSDRLHPNLLHHDSSDEEEAEVRGSSRNVENEAGGITTTTPTAPVAGSMAQAMGLTGVLPLVRLGTTQNGALR